MKYEKICSCENVFFDGPLLISPQIFKDEIGYFYESWNRKLFNNIIGQSINFLSR